MTTLFLVLIGAFVGWNLPQPEWASKFQAKVMAAIKKSSL